MGTDTAGLPLSADLFARSSQWSREWIRPGLIGKRAVVTGGTRSVGRTIAETLAQEGCNVGICARDAAQVRETVLALKAHSVNAAGGVADVADGEALKAWIRKAGEELGGIDILVSNPSGWGGKSDEAWKHSFDVDLMGAVRSVESAKPFLVRAAADKGDAAIVIISSVSAAEIHDTSSYGPMKAALIHLAKGLAKENAPRHIRANTISPGPVYFEGGVWHRIEQDNPVSFKVAMGMCPMGRMATPQDVANAAVFLASPVSSCTSGINLVADGAATNRVNFQAEEGCPSSATHRRRLARCAQALGHLRHLLDLDPTRLNGRGALGLAHQRSVRRTVETPAPCQGWLTDPEDRQQGTVGCAPSCPGTRTPRACPLPGS